MGQVLHNAKVGNLGRLGNVGGQDTAQNLLSCSELVKKDLPLSGKVLTFSAALADLPAQHICLSLTSLHSTSAQSAWADHNVLQGKTQCAAGCSCSMHDEQRAEYCHVLCSMGC